jgi:glycine cleavage system H protein
LKERGMAYPTNYKYSKEHEWIDVKGDVATIGITDYAQSELGDVVFVELPAAGTKLTAGKQFASVESVKAVSEIYAPASGEATESNAALQAKPETINSDPHGAGWLIKLKLSNAADLNALMDAAGYEKYIEEKKKEASA